MGHADIATTMIYVHHVPQIDAAERLVAGSDDFVSRAVSPTAEFYENSEKVSARQEAA